METSSVSSASTPDQYQALVAQKGLDQQQTEGQQNLKLIQSAAPALATEGSVGTQLHVVA